VGDGLDPALEAVIRDVPGWSGSRIEAVPIEAGITNRNFQVNVDGSSFVVRLPGRDTELLGIDRAAEHQAAFAAAAAGVGPEVVAFLPERGVLVTRFVPGANIPAEDLRSREILALVVDAIRRFHGCPPIPASFPVFRIVEGYRDLAASRGVRVPAEYREAHAVATEIEHAFSFAPAPETTCHDDLLNANFLLDGDHVWLVDFEYAGVGDPWFDLANFSINNDLDDRASEMVLDLYFPDVTDVHRARLGLMRIVSDLREAMWGVVQQGLSVLDVDYVAYAARHFERCLANANDGRVPAWLRVAATESGWTSTAPS
jgi:thiamine kinase-like enzyme